MGLHVVLAATDGWLGWGLMALNILKVIIALGFLIFVHELGHFLVAKLSGVKCEKFYLGFDIFGLKLLKFRWGETEYGIGVLPLGGYVKMLGQEDNPARLREEVERAKARQSANGGQESTPPDAPSEAEIQEAEKALYDPRSYLAQSVPKRMAIISAGVIMNLIFAVVTAVAAYGLGVTWVQPEIGATFPGEAAWRAGLRVGDRIKQIKGEPVERFTDLQKAISVGDIEGGVPMVIERPGVEEELTVRVVPDRLRVAPTIGISGPLSTVLREPLPVLPGSAAARATPPFQSGDRVVAVDGQPVEEYYQIHAQLALNPEKPLEFTVERLVPQDGDAERAELERHVIEVPPQPVRSLGLVMEMGPITAIQRGSPADEAGLKVGDRIRAIDGEPIGNPLRLPDRLRQRAEQEPKVALTVLREGKELEIPVRLRRAPWYEEPNPVFPGNPMSIPALGVAYQVTNRIVGVEPGSPAAKAGVPTEAVVVRAVIQPPTEEALEKLELDEAAEALASSVELEFDRDEPKNWPFFFFTLQTVLPGSRVELELDGGRKFTLEPAVVADWYNPDRGFLFAQKEIIRQAASLGDAIVLGTRETAEALTLIFRLLGKLGSQVSPKALGGPVSIAVMAYQSASEGLADLLIFLTVIGANLAVINFLPIPVLDGGHMVFLLYEGVRGKPPSERVHLTLSYLGLLFILGLMIFVLGLDIQRLLPG